MIWRDNFSNYVNMKNLMKNEDALYPFKTEAETPLEFLTDPYPALRKTRIKM